MDCVSSDDRQVLKESIERLVEEVQALSIIYPGCGDGKSIEDNDELEFTVLSIDEYKSLVHVAELIRNHEDENHLIDDKIQKINPICIELRATVKNSTKSSSTVEAVLQFTLPLGYPIITPASVCVVSIDTLNRSQREDIAAIMNHNAEVMVGAEALMDLIQFFQHDILSKFNEENFNTENQTDKIINIAPSTSNNLRFSRRWIWVHHVTNMSRCKAIVEEGNSLGLYGFLKTGYPGVVVVEGITESCDRFVSWIKGSKSRENGFGRNWGHHVRGQIDDCDQKIKSIFQQTRDEEIIQKDKFVHVGEDLKQMASVCKDAGVHEEFLTFIMQHK